MLYNICYWCFFLSQGNLWTKYLARPKIRRTKLCLLVFASLVALDGFHRLLSPQLTTDLTLEWSGESMFYPWLLNYAKLLFVALKQLQRTLWMVDALFLIDCEHTDISCKAENTLASDIFNSSAISRTFNLRSVKTSLWSFLFIFFFMFSETAAEFGWPESPTSFVFVRPRLKSAYYLLTVVSDKAESE